MPDTPKDKHALQLILRELTTVQMQFILDPPTEHTKSTKNNMPKSTNGCLVCITNPRFSNPRAEEKGERI